MEDKQFREGFSLLEQHGLRSMRGSIIRNLPQVADLARAFRAPRSSSITWAGLCGSAPTRAPTRRSKTWSRAIGRWQSATTSTSSSAALGMPIGGLGFSEHDRAALLRRSQRGL